MLGAGESWKSSDFGLAGGMLPSTVGVVVRVLDMCDGIRVRRLPLCGVLGISLPRSLLLFGLSCSMLVRVHLGGAPVLGVILFVCILEPWPVVGWLK